MFATWRSSGLALKRSEDVAQQQQVCFRRASDGEVAAYTKEDLKRVAAEAYSKALRDINREAIIYPQQQPQPQQFPAVYIHNSAAVENRLSSTTSVIPQGKWKWAVVGGIALVAWYYFWEESRRKKEFRRRRLEYSTLHRIAYWILNQ